MFTSSHKDTKTLFAEVTLVYLRLSLNKYLQGFGTDRALVQWLDLFWLISCFYNTTNHLQIGSLLKNGFQVIIVWKPGHIMIDSISKVINLICFVISKLVTPYLLNGYNLSLLLLKHETWIYQIEGHSFGSNHYLFYRHYHGK